MIRALVLVACGSALGGVARHAVAGWVHARVGTALWPGTVLVNVSGSLLLGALLGAAAATPAITPEWRAFLGVGLCGGFTTFSTFSWETLVLLQAGHYRRAGLYVLLSIALALLATALGFVAGRAAAGGGGG